MSSKLKSCPFCGGLPRIEKRSNASNTKHWTRVACPICPWVAFDDVASWNRRATPAPAPGAPDAVAHVKEGLGRDRRRLMEALDTIALTSTPDVARIKWFARRTLEQLEVRGDALLPAGELPAPERTLAASLVALLELCRRMEARLQLTVEGCIEDDVCEQCDGEMQDGDHPDLDPGHDESCPALLTCQVLHDLDALRSTINEQLRAIPPSTESKEPGNHG